MAVTIEELEIIVKAKADEALPILEKVQAKLNEIMRKSLPGLQQAAGTAADVTEKAVKNVEKPVKEAVEALGTVSAKSSSAGKAVGKAFEAARKNIAKTEAEIDAVNAALDRIRTEKRDNYIPEGAPNQQYVLESLLAQDKEYQKLLQRSDELVHLWDRQNAELERQQKLLEESRRKQDEIATQQTKNTASSTKRAPALARPVNANYISPDTYGTEYESLVNAVNKANYVLEAQRQKYAALRAERMALLSLATNEAGANGSPSPATLARIDDCTARMERERLALDQVSASARNAELALNSAFGENNIEGQGGKALFSKLFGWCKKGISLLGKLGKSVLRFNSGMKKASGGVQSFGTRLRSIVSGALIFNGISAALRKMTVYLKNAILSVQQMRGAISNLKGAASVAAAPIIQTLTPALSALANAAATVFSYIAKLISLLTGKSISSMKSAAKSMHSYGNAAGSAAKDVKDLQKANNTLGFDELNVIDTGKEDDASSGGGGGADEILPNFDFEGKSTLLDQVLEAIKGGDWERAGAILAEKANSILNGFDADSWGQKFGKKLQNGISFAYGLITTFDWNSLGAKLAGIVNGLLDQVDGAQIGALFAAKFTIAIRTLGTFLANLDWATLGAQIISFVIGFLTAFADALQSVDWSAIGIGIATMLMTIDWAGVISAVFEVIKAAFPILLSGLLAFIGMHLVKMIGGSLLSTLITSAGQSISTFFSTMLPTVLSNLGTWLTTIISSIGLWPIAIAGLVVLFIALVNQFGDAIQAKLQEVDAWLQGIFTRDWSETFGILGNLLNAFFSNVKNIWDSIKLVFDGIIDFIRGVFTGDWERAWKGVKEIFAGIFGALKAVALAPINAVIGLLNGLIDAVNWVIEKINGISFTNPFTGNTVGFSFPTIAKIPMLATGAVLKEPTLFAGGEYPGANNNPEIVAPESRMKKAFLEALGSANAAGFGGDIVVNITEDIDGEVLYRNQHRIKMNRGASVGGVFTEAY